VLTPVFGDGRQGRALVLADVDLIVFTGSRETGTRILGDAAAGLKRVILELGGKDPLIVLDDADLDLAAAFAARNSFRNAGQVCVSTERIYVDERIRADFLAKLVERANALRQGNPAEEGVQIGPMVNARQKAKVLAQIESAVAAGARVLAGGEAREGNFVAPTVLSEVDHAMEIMREETFGPVACVQGFRTVDEAVRLANDSPFGLGAAVFGRDAARAAEPGLRRCGRLPVGRCEAVGLRLPLGPRRAPPVRAGARDLPPEVSAFACTTTSASPVASIPRPFCSPTRTGTSRWASGMA
jgi:succinate-semialdehyde dehydrogenase/glutarate-semialdehyde dehydrogenase